MSTAPTFRPWPTDLVFDRGAKRLRIRFDDGAKFEIPFELLRVESPSAEGRGHGTAPLPPVKGKAAVGVVRAEPVGRYAVRIVFDDGHDTGLYAWDFLYDLGLNLDGRLRAYRNALVADAADADA